MVVEILQMIVKVFLTERRSVLYIFLMNIRPTHKELNRKIRQAKLAVTEGRICVIRPDVIADDALELGYLLKDLKDVLAELLDEIMPERYMGKKPPERSYEEDVRGLELLGFEVFSKRFGDNIYFKFVLKDEDIWLVSLHQSRKSGRLVW